MKNFSVLQAYFKWSLVSFLLAFMLHPAKADTANTLPFPQKQHTFLGKMKHRIAAAAYRFSPKMQKIVKSEKYRKDAGNIALVAALATILGFFAIFTSGVFGLILFCGGGLVAFIAGIIAISGSKYSKNATWKGAIGIVIGVLSLLITAIAVLFILSWNYNH
jgi:hypothetical protein